MHGPRVGGGGEIRRLFYAAGRNIITAEICEPALLESARCLFPHYEVSAPRGERRVSPSVSLRSSSEGYIVTAPDEPFAVCRSEMEALAVFEFALTRAFLTSFCDYVHLHASGAVIDGRAMLALGKSGAGKSSLAAAWLSQGFPTLGDDIVFLDSAARAVPFKRLLKISHVALQGLGVDPAATVLWDPEWADVWYAPDANPGWAEAAPVAALAFLRYDPDACLRLIPMSPAEALNATIHSKMDSGRGVGDGFDTLLRVAEGARAYWVEYASAAEAAAAICALAR